MLYMHILYLHTYICTYFSATFIFGYSLHSITPRSILFRRKFQESWRLLTLVHLILIPEDTRGWFEFLLPMSFFLDLRQLPSDVIEKLGAENQAHQCDLWINLMILEKSFSTLVRCALWSQGVLNGFHFIIFLRVFSMALGGDRGDSPIEGQ